MTQFAHNSHNLPHPVSCPKSYVGQAAGKGETPKDSSRVKKGLLERNIDIESTSEKGTSEKSRLDELTTKNEKFELLSAYIDGEVSEEERQKVETWLISDGPLQQHYKAQLKLSQAITSLFAQIQ
ncbi:MAG: zf-HC2 domain-containing protein [Cyanobacteria bacterium P01_D01_bin.105]